MTAKSKKGTEENTKKAVAELVNETGRGTLDEEVEALKNAIDLQLDSKERERCGLAAPRAWGISWSEGDHFFSGDVNLAACQLSFSVNLFSRLI